MTLRRIQNGTMAKRIQLAYFDQRLEDRLPQLEHRVAIDERIQTPTQQRNEYFHLHHEGSTDLFRTLQRRQRNL